MQTFERIAEAASTIPGVADAAIVVCRSRWGPAATATACVPEGRAFEPGNTILSRLRIVTPDYIRDDAHPDRQGARASRPATGAAA